MATQSFRDLIVWQKSHVFVVDMYAIFGTLKDYSFKDQILRASVSIMNNIAEGYARRSDKAFRNLLMISKGSASEVESMLELAYSLKYISEKDYEELVTKVVEISKMLHSFSAKLKALD